MARYYNRRPLVEILIECDKTTVNEHTRTMYDRVSKLRSALSCLELGLPALADKWGQSSQEVADVRELLAAIEKNDMR